MALKFTYKNSTKLFKTLLIKNGKNSIYKEI